MGRTHRPGELEGDHDLSSVVEFIRVFGALERKDISTEYGCRFRSVGALAFRVDLHLILLKASVDVNVALVSTTPPVLGVPCAIAAFPVRQLAIYILYVDQLELKIAG